MKDTLSKLSPARRAAIGGQGARKCVRVVSEWVKEGGKGASTEVLVINLASARSIPDSHPRELRLDLT
jgi:hypothetical protein